MALPQHRESLPELIALHRRALLAYIFAIVRDHHRAEDVFQETLLVLARQWDTYETVHSFHSLARAIARRQALAALRKDQRAPMLLSEAALDALDAAVGAEVEPEPPVEALDHCLEKAPGFWQNVIRLRYWERLSVIAIAEALGRSPNTISVTLNRMRLRLADCIRHYQRQGRAQ
jgi:RNA polymerase sigma-70 factor (ECF subfamily)